MFVIHNRINPFRRTKRREAETTVTEDSVNRRLDHGRTAPADSSNYNKAPRLGVPVCGAS
ncbi:hypothetical protein KNP414_01673 [Paenibacillus mucilaginosus KNP414]|uniref:Uncharacterized protein n=1 Tax=Paenibacillus mucilaginosus (strain KNP414) TaxID=1036673 RepID=F8FPL2_PAEMK|nr:hypothetical protein KNP414_01673 [Paenibacillus mucilaginosus KNP414]